MISLGEMKFPPNISPRVREALEEVLALVELRFTGTLSIDFNDGVPMRAKRLDHRQFGGPATPRSP